MHSWDTIVVVGVAPQSSEEQRIVAEYHIATERYAAAVGELTQLRATMTAQDYTKLLNIVEDARKECERIHSSLAKLHDDPSKKHFIVNGRLACGQTNTSNSTNALDLVTCERCLEVLRATKPPETNKSTV
jgi:hypothetical protein